MESESYSISHTFFCHNGSQLGMISFRVVQAV